MGEVIIQSYTHKNPITMIGEEAGICYGSDINNAHKNFTRGIDCLERNHGRTFEFPDVYMILNGYSARVIREWYTHIGGMPTRLQESTRYINYQKGFDYVIPPRIMENNEAYEEYKNAMQSILKNIQKLDKLGIPKEDSALCLPLGMKTSIVCKMNFRTLIDMSHQRMCTRAYHEFRKLFFDLSNALKNYSKEWAYLVDNYFMPKCDITGYCTEQFSCGRNHRKDD